MLRKVSVALRTKLRQTEKTAPQTPSFLLVMFMKPLNDNICECMYRLAYRRILWEYDFPVDYVKTRIMLDVEHEDLNRE